MRARLARPRRIVRGRLVAPVAAAAAVALVGGVVVATPDTPTVRQDIQTVATTISGFQAGAGFSFDVGTIEWAGGMAGFEVTGVEGLPDGLTYENGVISGTPTESGTFDITFLGTLNGEPTSYVIPLTVVEAGASAGSAGAVQGSLGGEATAGGELTTGSDGTDALLGAVTSIVAALGVDTGSAGELATGSTGGTTTDTPTGPLGSVTTGETGGDATGTVTTDSLGPTGPLGSVLDSETTMPGSTTGGEVTGETDGRIGGELAVPGSSVPGVEIPGSSTTGTTGSLGDLAPGLALTGAALLGIAGLSIILNGGSSTPGVSSSLPSLPGSSTTTGGTTGSTEGSSGSTQPVAPIVAAGTPTKQAPGPTVANGRG